MRHPWLSILVLILLFTSPGCRKLRLNAKKADKKLPDTATIVETRKKLAARKDHRLRHGEAVLEPEGWVARNVRRAGDHLRAAVRLRDEGRPLRLVCFESEDDRQAEAWVRLSFRGGERQEGLLGQAGVYAVVEPWGRIGIGFALGRYALLVQGERGQMTELRGYVLDILRINQHLSGIDVPTPSSSGADRLAAPARESRVGAPRISEPLPESASPTAPPVRRPNSSNVLPPPSVHSPPARAIPIPVPVRRPSAGSDSARPVLAPRESYGDQSLAESIRSYRKTRQREVEAESRLSARSLAHARGESSLRPSPLIALASHRSRQRNRLPSRGFRRDTPSGPRISTKSKSMTLLAALMKKGNEAMAIGDERRAQFFFERADSLSRRLSGEQVARRRIPAIRERLPIRPAANPGEPTPNPISAPVPPAPRNLRLAAAPKAPLVKPPEATRPPESRLRAAGTQKVPANPPAFAPALPAPEATRWAMKPAVEPVQIASAGPTRIELPNALPPARVVPRPVILAASKPAIRKPASTAPASSSGEPFYWPEDNAPPRGAMLGPDPSSTSTETFRSKRPDVGLDTADVAVKPSKPTVEAPPPLAPILAVKPPTSQIPVEATEPDVVATTPLATNIVETSAPDILDPFSDPPAESPPEQPHSEVVPEPVTSVEPETTDPADELNTDESPWSEPEATPLEPEPPVTPTEVPAEDPPEDSFDVDEPSQEEPRSETPASTDLPPENSDEAFPASDDPEPEPVAPAPTLAAEATPEAPAQEGDHSPLLIAVTLIVALVVGALGLLFMLWSRTRQGRETLPWYYRRM